MALASIIINIYHETGPGPGPGTYPYSWLSKAKATGMNKHMAWILAALLFWRKFTC
jgi:hypothetical protein